MLDLRRIQCLGEAFVDAMVTYKSNVALIEANRHRENGQWTYAEVRREAERVGALLQQHGVEPGDRVAILMSNQARWVLSAVGALWSGAVLVPLDYKLTASEQAQLLEHAAPRVLVTEHHMHGPLRESLDGAMTVVVTEAPGDEPVRGAVRWEARPEGDFRYQARTRQDLASIVYSSGTGGTPKGCMLLHDNYLEQAQVLGRLFPMGETDRYFSVLPTNHAIDFMCGMIVPFLFGAAVVHQRTLRPEFFPPTMKRYGITHIALVPRILKSLAERIREQLDELPEWKKSMLDGLMSVNDLATARKPNHTLSRSLLKPLHDKFGGQLRMIFAGGAFVDPGLADFFYRLGLPVVIGYGLTEACTVLTVNDLSPYRGTTVGKPVEGVEIELRNEDAAGVGEVVARGRTIMRGYLNQPELTAETLVDGWLQTGDLGTFDASGHLRLVGRARNMIVTEGGKNIYPEDIEAAFEELPCEELCVFARDYIWPRQGLTDEQLTLVVRARSTEGGDCVVDLVRQHNQKLADFKRVGSVVLWADEFPRTASEKLKRNVLAEQIRAGSSQPEALGR